MAKITLIALVSILYLQHFLALPTPEDDRYYDKEVSVFNYKLVDQNKIDEHTKKSDSHYEKFRSLNQCQSLVKPQLSSDL